MTDDLDDLRRALKSAPAADAAARDRALALAMANFDRLQTATQGTPDAARPTEDRPARAGFLNGVRSMLNFMTRRPTLAATTSVAALVIGVAVILPVTEGLRPGLPPVAPRSEAPAAAPAAGTEAAPAVPETAAKMAPPEAATPMADPAPADAPPMAEAEAAPPAAKRVADADAPVIALAPEGGAPVDDRETADMAYLDEGAARARTGVVAPAPSVVVAEPAPLPPLADNTEAYANEDPNPVKITAEEPVSTFSTDVDTASYALVRSTLDMGVLPMPDQVRIEEMVNYFPYAYPAPEDGQAFSTSVAVMPTPWNAGTQLVTIGLQGALPAVADRPALNLVFLIDTSGSMEAPNKLGLLKQSLALMLPELRPEDQIAIVAYAGSAGVVLEPTVAKDEAKILAALDSLSAGGSTAGAEGLELAYQLAEGMTAEGEVSRILLATDGDFNVGLSDPAGLTDYVARKRQEGTYLSVLGFGRGNLDDATMQALAQNGNGTASYIDTLSEARKVLVDQLTGALFPIADDVKVQVEWNPAEVAEYRLIGYETRALKREDFNNDKVDAGEIGAGLQVTAIYEITPVGSDAVLNDPLRYGTAVAGGEPGELGFLRLRWKAPGEDTSDLIERPITGEEPATEDSRFAAAIAGFGQLLQGSVYLGNWGWTEAITLAQANRGDDPYGYRIEAVNLMRMAQTLAR
ncbi:vWA domain-containing protein [Neotabrizicola sp. VNH66]|uniref:vWA domain-containing protein n=1 Tax=Neotabrizicola sp. VNH66 TaxID=3400918 RepID=UPI003C107C3C